MEKLHWEMVRLLFPDNRSIHERPVLTYVRNRGELAEGWYDPSTLQKAVQSAAEYDQDSYGKERPDSASRKHTTAATSQPMEDSDSNESIGPSLPGQEGRSRGRMGPSIPNVQDLALKRGEHPGLVRV